MFLLDERRVEGSLRGRDEGICCGQGAASIFFVLDHLLYVSNMLNPDTTEVKKGELYDAVT